MIGLEETIRILEKRIEILEEKIALQRAPLEPEQDAWPYEFTIRTPDHSGVLRPLSSTYYPQTSAWENREK